MICLECNGEFLGKRSYCSSWCKREYRRKIRLEKTINRRLSNPKNCHICSKVIPLSENSRSLFCGEKCRKLHVATYAKSNSNPVPLRNTGDTGAASEMIACAELLRRGYEVFRAVSPSASCDLIAVSNDGSFRIQVKTGFVKISNGEEKLTHPAALDKSKYDVLAVVTLSDFVVKYTPDMPFLINHRIDLEN